MNDMTRKLEAALELALSLQRDLKGYSEEHDEDIAELVATLSPASELVIEGAKTRRRLAIGMPLPRW